MKVGDATPCEIPEHGKQPQNARHGDVEDDKEADECSDIGSATERKRSAANFHHTLQNESCLANPSLPPHQFERPPPLVRQRGTVIHEQSADVVHREEIA